MVKITDVPESELVELVMQRVSATAEAAQRERQSNERQSKDGAHVPGGWTKRWWLNTIDEVPEGNKDVGKGGR